MTSTPVSLNESLNGSWIDINSASQIHSPIDNDSPEHLRPPYSLAESVQSLGLLSFQVERFLQEAQKSQGGAGASNQDGQQQQPYHNVDNISDLCFSDSDVSADCIRTSKPMMDSLREYHNSSQHQHQYHPSNTHNEGSRRISKNGDCFVDQLSDSLSLLSRASLFGEAGLRSSASQNTLDQANSFEDFDWLWDWTAQPEYFTGQEWKVSPPKQEHMMRQRQLYSGSRFSNKHDEKLFSGEIMSLLFLTNILSIIIGAGITYSILMRRSNL